MKYIILLGDGMADLPDGNGNTPLALAHKPNIDFMAAHGEVGMVRTVAYGLKPGSDVANLSVLGYDPAKYYTGRSPLEAASLGIDITSNDLAIRCNLVTLSDDENYERKIMLDYSADEITTADAGQLIAFLNDKLMKEYDNAELFCGVSYRHCLKLKNAAAGTKYSAPHDFSDKAVAGHLPVGRYAALITELQQNSYQLLKDHPVNLSRVKRGLKPANSIWLWGEGSKPELPCFSDKFGKSGAIISAVDLLKGIGKLAGMKVYESPEFTGNINTNYELKANTALKALDEGVDFLFIHIEAPDECGHRGEYENKIKAIEYIDSKLLRHLREGLSARELDYCMMILPDHATPLVLKTHTSDPVPYIIFRSDSVMHSGINSYSERSAQSTGILHETGHELINRLFNFK